MPWADPIDGEASRPEIVHTLCHGYEAPIGFRIVTVEQARGHVIVAIGENNRCDGNLIAQNPANRMSASVKLRRNLLNDDTRTALRWLDQARPPAHGCLAVRPLKLSTIEAGKVLPVYEKRDARTELAGYFRCEHGLLNDQKRGCQPVASTCY